MNCVRIDGPDRQWTWIGVVGFHRFIEPNRLPLRFLRSLLWFFPPLEVFVDSGMKRWDLRNTGGVLRLFTQEDPCLQSTGFIG